MDQVKRLTGDPVAEAIQYAFHQRLVWPGGSRMNVNVTDMRYRIERYEPEGEVLVFVFCTQRNSRFMMFGSSPSSSMRDLTAALVIRPSSRNVCHYRSRSDC